MKNLKQNFTNTLIETVKKTLLSLSFSRSFKCICGSLLTALTDNYKFTSNTYTHTNK